MEELLLRLLIVLAVVTGAGAFGWWWQRRQGRVVEPMAAHDSRPVFDRRQLDEVGLRLVDAPAGAVLLSSPTCASCTQVQGILGEIAETRPGFEWVSVDAGEHLDLARQHQVMRVPTLFVVGPDGHLLARTSGVPARHELERLLDRPDRTG